MPWISDQDYKFIYNRSVRTCVDMVIRDQNGHLFLTLRDINPYKGLWHFPGGAIRFKELMADAVVRIALKEFGCGVQIIKVLGYCETINDDLGPDDQRHSNSIVVEVKLLGKPVSTKESAAVEYFQTLPENMRPYHEEFIRSEGLL